QVGNDMPEAIAADVVVGAPPVGVYLRATRDVFEHEIGQSVGSRVRDPPHPHPAGTALAALHGDHHQRLALRATPALARLDAAHERLIDLDGAIEELP